MKVQALHHQGLLDEAMAWGQACIEQCPTDAELFAALSVAAVDNEQMDLAEAYALRAGDTHEGQSTLGMIALSAFVMISFADAASALAIGLVAGAIAAATTRTYVDS